MLGILFANEVQNLRIIHFIDRLQQVLVDHVFADEWPAMRTVSSVSCSATACCLAAELVDLVEYRVQLVVLDMLNRLHTTSITTLTLAEEELLILVEEILELLTVLDQA